MNVCLLSAYLFIMRLNAKHLVQCRPQLVVSRFRIHSLDSRVAHGANDVRLLHSLHDRRNVLLLKLQVLLVLFYNAHFCGKQHKQRFTSIVPFERRCFHLRKHLNAARVTVDKHFQLCKIRNVEELLRGYKKVP